MKDMIFLLRLFFGSVWNNIREYPSVSSLDSSNLALFLPLLVIQHRRYFTFCGQVHPHVGYWDLVVNKLSFDFNVWLHVHKAVLLLEDLHVILDDFNLVLEPLVPVVRIGRVDFAWFVLALVS